MPEPQTRPAVTTPDVAPPVQRVLSIDAYRGFVMFLMMAEVLHLPELMRPFVDSFLGGLIYYHTTHVSWTGCSLHDLIQPSFTFLVGAAMPFSLAGRLRRGQSVKNASLHAAWRAVLLVVLGIFLRSIGKPQTNFTFEDTLTQIGLGYFPLFLLGLCRARWHYVALVAILVGYWGAFALYPVAPPGFDYPAVNVPADWKFLFSGFEAHWNKNSNLAWAFDTWFLNLFPREAPFTNNKGGYVTLSFIPTLGTMILGLIAGGWLRDTTNKGATALRMAAVGLAALAVDWLLDYAGVCPIVKRIWTPTWVLWSGGWAFLLLAGFYAVIDVAGYQRWSLFLRMIGMNSIAAYMIAHLFEPFLQSTMRTHLGQEFFHRFGNPLELTIAGAAVLAIYCWILWWMYQRKIFLRV